MPLPATDTNSAAAAFTSGLAPAVCRVLILGSTGSIGTQTLAVIAHLNALARAGRWPTHYEVVGLLAGKNAELLGAQASTLAAAGHSRIALGIGDAAVAASAGESLPLTFTGAGAAEQMVRSIPADLVVAAMVGAAGMPATLAAAELGRKIALANKETLVAAGELIVPLCIRSGAMLLPVDSEHSAIWQILAGARTASGSPCLAPPFITGDEVARIVLTASGGALRKLDRAAMASATAEMALKHPTWTMGAKVTIDSASLTNKAFELIEAHWLFGVSPERLGVSVHPQSMVHSMVEFIDGSVLAQISPPDMRLPIALALTWPLRAPAITRRVDWQACTPPVTAHEPMPLGTMEFEPPDEDRYPALAIAREVMRSGGTSGAIFNAASEEATSAFIEGRIRFGAMTDLVRGTLDAVSSTPLLSLHDALHADAAARRCAHQLISRML